MRKVLAIMGTYNGEKYVSEQIQSIIDQEGVISYLVIRDDASTDSTPMILKNFKSKYPDRIQLFLGNRNLFPFNYDEIVRIGNFEGFDYFAFSDHDDVWMKDKLITAVEKLEQMDNSKPCLYYSNLAVTDVNLNYRFDVYGKNKIAATPETCLVDLAASGNTFVLNRKALDIYRFDDYDKNFYKDVWLEVLLYFIGDVTYDDTPHIWFRRTGSNVSGSRERGVKLWVSRAKRIIKEKKTGGKKMHSRMARYMIDNYGDRIDKERLEILSEIANYQNSFKDKCKLLFDSRIRSKSFSRNLTFKGRIILNLL